MKSIRLSAEAVAAIREESASAYPQEACGLLLGTRGEECDEVLSAAGCRNLARDPRRFELHPEDFLAAELRAVAETLHVIGVWHSHPDEPAIPSESDRAGAYPGWCYLIAQTTSASVTSIRGWALGDGQFVERPLSLTNWPAILEQDCGGIAPGTVPGAVPRG